MTVLSIIVYSSSLVTFLPKSELLVCRIVFVFITARISEGFHVVHILQSYSVQAYSCPFHRSPYRFFLCAHVHTIYCCSNLIESIWIISLQLNAKIIRCACVYVCLSLFTIGCQFWTKIPFQSQLRRYRLQSDLCLIRFRWSFALSLYSIYFPNLTLVPVDDLFGAHCTNALCTPTTRCVKVEPSVGLWLVFPLSSPVSSPIQPSIHLFIHSFIHLANS